MASGIMLKLGGDRYFTSTDLQDRSGVDLFVTTPVGFYGVDVKTYSKTFRDKTGSPCLILEYVSNLENNKPGWLVDKTKTTDYLCFAFQEQGRFILTPYLPLRSYFITNIQDFLVNCKPIVTCTNSYGRQYTSLCLAVPFNRYIHNNFENYIGEF